MDEDTWPLLASQGPTDGEGWLRWGQCQASRARGIRKGFLEVELYGLGTSMCGRQQSFLARHLAGRSKVPHAPQGASVPVWPEPPGPGQELELLL